MSERALTLLSQADALRAQGAHASALAIYDRALAEAPPANVAAVVLTNRGLTRRAQGDAAGARADWEQALTHDPNQLAALTNLAQVCLDLGAPAEAWALTARAVTLDPDSVVLWRLRVTAGLGQGNPEGLATAAETLLRLQPGADSLYLHGLALNRQGRRAEAIAALEQARALADGNPWVSYALGIWLYQAGRYAQAAEVMAEATARMPENVAAWTTQALATLSTGRVQAARQAAEQAVAVGPGDAQAWNALGLVHQRAGRFEDALTAFVRARDCDSHDGGITLNMAGALVKLHRTSEAEPLLLPLRDHAVHGPLIRDTLFYVAATLRKDAEAHTAACAALAVAGPKETRRLLSSFLTWCLYGGRGPAAETLALARMAADLAAPADPLPPLPARPRDEHPLRVGYLSHDLNAEPALWFVNHVLAAHDPARVVPTLYSRLGEHPPALPDLDGRCRVRMLTATDETLAARRLRDDHLDVLVDLTGHVGVPHLTLLRQRVAPVQVSWLGYFATTGVPEVDYWIGDPVLVPEGEEAWFTEKVWRVPRCWLSWEPRPQAPAVAWRPCETPRLASFNQISKMNSRTVALWAACLRRLPTATLLLKAAVLRDPAVRQAVQAAFADHGIPAARLDLRDTVPAWGAHMDLYNTVDVALDPAEGVCGGITTLEALWMGVPVVTPSGAHAPQRMTASMLTALDRTAWVAEREETFVDTVAALVAERATCGPRRVRQREEMAASPLCDGGAMARALETAFTAMIGRL